MGIGRLSNNNESTRIDHHAGNRCSGNFVEFDRQMAALLKNMRTPSRAMVASPPKTNRRRSTPLKEIVSENI